MKNPTAVDYEQVKREAEEIVDKIKACVDHCCFIGWPGDFRKHRLSVAQELMEDLVQDSRKRSEVADL